MKSTIVLTLADGGSFCKFAIIKGAVHQLVSGGIPAAEILRKSNLTGSADEIRIEVERTFNLGGNEYVATLQPTRSATIFEAGNGLPGFNDLVIADDELWKIVTPDADLRITTNGPGQGNSIFTTLLCIGGPCDLTDDQWESVHDGRVVLH